MVMVALPSFATASANQTLKLYEMEDRLKDVIMEIEREERLSSRRIICLMGRALLQETRENPWNTTAKCIFFMTAIAAMYPASLGSLACLNSYRLDHLTNIDSPNLEKANISVQLFSNLGQGVTYIMQTFELFLIPSGVWLFRGLRDRVVCQEIASICMNTIQKYPPLSREERVFLVRRANGKIALQGGLPISQEGVEHIQQRIDSEKRRLLSKRNILKLVIREVMQDAKNASWTTRIARTVASFSLVGLTLAAQHSLYYGTRACFAAFRVASPSDLISSDINTSTRATGLYSNLGHAAEYIVSGFVLAGLTTKVLFENKYKKITRGLIERVYNKHIQDDSLSREESNLLYKRKVRELERYV